MNLHTLIFLSNIFGSPHNPIAVKRVDILDMDRMNMTFYIFANENGVATIGVLNLLNPTITETITEILDTIIVEDTI